MTAERRIVIIGAGPGGLCIGSKLLAAGYEDFVILEQADGVGGTWRHNTYPGAACDVPSHLYAFSFEPKADWTRTYATQPEILEYFEHCAVKYGLESHLRLRTPVRSTRWDDVRQVWHVATDDDDLEADVLVGAVGMFNEPSWPDIAGLDTFAGTTFHSARWDHDHDLAGERVAVIGSGASAVQLIPSVAAQAAQLFLFQRQPQWVSPKIDPAYEPDQLAQFRADPSSVEALRTQIFERIDPLLTFSNPDLLRMAEKAGLQNLALVEDPDVRQRLTPAVPFGCHRPLISNDYYPVFNLPHVELVGEPIERIDRDAIVTADGRRRAVDTIIVATGFATTRYLSVIDVVGRDGRRLDDAWEAGAQAYLGIATTGFPNMFMLYGPNTNNGSILFMIECQSDYIVGMLGLMDAEGLVSVDVRADVLEQYNDALQRDLDGIDVWHSGCHGYYRVASGRIVTQWPHSMSEYHARTAHADLDAYVATPANADAPA
jgi:cation diffusion facilitator CzcD-associated flavoprotein CzcO